MSDCALCNGLRMVVEEKNGDRMARQCECVALRKIEWNMSRSGIPRLYKESTLDNYETGFNSCTESQKLALLMAKKFVETMAPMVHEKPGIVFSGGVGVGKTHIAVGILNAVVYKGQTGIFYDQVQLLKLLRESYEKESNFEESYVLNPALERDVVVLDDLGSMPLTDWGREKIINILGERYNNGLATIITTNFAYEGSLLTRADYEDRTRADSKGRSEPATTAYTLGDRITDRMFSRLEQSCIHVRISGTDFRRKIRRAEHEGMMGV